MTVYVDDYLEEATVGNIRGKWSHLLADNHDELMEFAILLGLRPSWIQHPHSLLEHFDITKSKRREAIKAGAIAISYEESGLLIAARRAGKPFMLDR